MLIPKRASDQSTVADVFSMDDVQRARKQPQFHRDQKGIKEILFFCCYESKDLNFRENKYFNQFKKTMIKEYDSKNKDHEQDLAYLFYIAFNK